MVKSPTGKIAGALAAFEDTIRQNNAAAGTTPASETTTTTTTTTASSPSHVVIPTKPRPRVPWKDSNLALVNSDLHHKITQAAAGLETAWKGIGDAAGTNVWRIEQFHVVAWPTDRYGDFYTGDSYIVLHAYRRGVSDALFFDVHIWIGQESSQDEYGTAAYKMVECDDFLGGRAVQHREVQGHESPVRAFYGWFCNAALWLCIYAY
jgi:gelsolin